VTEVNAAHAKIKTIESPTFPNEALEAIAAIENPFVGSEVLKRMLADACPTESWTRNFLNKPPEVNEVIHMVKELPPETYQMWKQLMQLCDMIKNNPVSKMNSVNLSIVLAPRFLLSSLSELSPDEHMRYYSLANKMVEFLIQKQAEIFV